MGNNMEDQNEERVPTLNDTVASKLLPFYNYREIRCRFRKLMKNRKWKKSMKNNMDDQNEEEVHDMDDNVASKLLPFYTYRQIIKNQRWKRPSDIFKPAYGFGKRTPLPKLRYLPLGLENYLFAPFHHQNLFMNSPVGKSFYNI